MGCCTSKAERAFRYEWGRHRAQWNRLAWVLQNCALLLGFSARHRFVCSHVNNSQHLSISTVPVEVHGSHLRVTVALHALIDVASNVPEAHLHVESTTSKLTVRVAAHQNWSSASAQHTGV